jgi:hypothetical protein
LILSTITTKNAVAYFLVFHKEKEKETKKLRQQNYYRQKNAIWGGYYYKFSFIIFMNNASDLPYTASATTAEIFGEHSCTSFLVQSLFCLLPAYFGEVTHFFVVGHISNFATKLISSNKTALILRRIRLAGRRLLKASVHLHLWPT